MTARTFAPSTTLEDAASGRDIDLAPMLDVVFILLIFFIVTASFVKEAAVDVQRPDATLPTTPDAPAITLRVDAAGHYTVNGYGVTRDGLASYLRRMQSELPNASFAILASPAATTDALVTAVDRARSVGFAEVPLKVLDD